MYIEKFSEEVYALVEKLVTRTERINSYQGKIPAIEIDLALEDIRKLYDCYLLVRSMASEMKPADIIAKQEAEPTVTRDMVEHPEPEIEHQPLITEEIEPVQEIQEQEHKQSEPIEIPVTEPAVHESDKVSGKILAERLTKDDQRTINDILASKKSDVSISSRIQHNPISNLKSSIGINEKFIFVYELFGGHAQHYADMIDQLNSMPGRNEAIALLETLRQEYRWDIENMAFQKLVDMVSRRYS